MTYNNIITVTEFGDYAPEIDTTKFDAPTVSGFVSAASRMASDYLGYSPYAEDIVNEVKNGMVDNQGDLIIFPEKKPIQSVSAIAIVKGTTEITLSLTSGANNRYNIDFTQRHIRYPYSEISVYGTNYLSDFYSLRGSQFYTKISYRGGWEVSQLPAPIKHAVVLLTKDLFYGQHNAMGVTRLSQGQVSFDFGLSSKEVSPNVKAARQLLNPYRAIG